VEEKEFVEKYFEVAKKIYSICLDELLLTIEDTRLYVYIYVKSIEYGNLDYFSKKDKNSEESINVLTNALKNNKCESQLKDRMQIHTDKKFRIEKLSFYIENILPRL
jgi:hypothetical protein